MDFISILSIFVLACFVGYYVVWSVTPALHTPLMAVTNAISSVIVVGALLAEEFLEIFDGFSIGSNDLTQLTLGLDRDSSIVAHLFDERDPAVKKLLSMAIQTARAKGKYVGICGQGPSDHPDLAQWLMEQGIESVSLNPDTVVDTWLKLAKAKARAASTG